jgi:uncharacterized protein YjcR
MTDTEDAYIRIQKMLSSRDESKTVIADISLTKEETFILSQAINKKLVKHAKIPEYHADIISDYIIGIVSDFINIKLKEAKQSLNNTKDGNIGSPMFKRSDD